MKRERHTDELFRNKLGTHEVASPEYLWDRIAEQLDEDKRKVRLVWFKRAALAASLLLAFIAGWQLQQSRTMQLKGDSVAIVKTKNVKSKGVDMKVTDSADKRESVVKNELVARNQKNTEENNSKVKTKQPVSRKLQTSVPSLSEPMVSANKKDVEVLAVHPSSSSGEEVKTTVPMTRKVSTAESGKNNEILAFNKISSIENKKFGNAIKAILLHKNPISESTLSELDRLIVAKNMEQTKVSKEKKKLNFSLGAQLASSASFNNPQNSGYSRNSYTESDAVPQPSKVDNLKAGMGAGLTFEVKTSKRISIQSGVFYSRLQQGNRGISVSNDSWPAIYTSLAATEPMPVKNNATWVANSAWGMARIHQYPHERLNVNAISGDLAGFETTSENVDYSQQAEYVEIPFLLRYKLFESRFRFDLLGGLGANFLVGNDFYQMRNGERMNIGETADLNSFSYSSIMGVGMSYGLNRTIRISLEPKLKYYLNSLSNNATVDMKPWIFGVYAGLNFNF